MTDTPVSRRARTTIAKAPITFAMIELADTADCNARRRLWLRYGFKDVTPNFGSRASVPCIDNAMVPEGRRTLRDLASVSADWYMISGHHGVIYRSEYGFYTSDGRPPNRDLSNLDPERFERLRNEAPYCGFFNESYHELYWHGAGRDSHAPNENSPRAMKLHEQSIYLRTTEAAPASIAAVSQENPVVDGMKNGPPPKGIIISACNTLFYARVRRMWSTRYPHAVVIGTAQRIVSGTWVANAVARAKMTTEQFFRDPASTLDEPGKPQQLEMELNRQYRPDAPVLGVLYKGRYYCGGTDVAAF